MNPEKLAVSRHESEEGSASLGEIKYQRVVPRTMTGHCNLKNKYAIDWGPSGLVAYGCGFNVVVVEPSQIKTVQMFHKHKAVVTKIKWSPGTQLVIASGDYQGQIYVWDVASGNSLHVLQDGTKPITDFLWVSGLDHGEQLLLALHPPYSVILWDTATGTKIWKKSYTEQLLMMDVDPFNPSKIAFVCQNCILLVDDFNPVKVPSSNGRKFYVTVPKTTTPQTPTVPLIGSDKSRERLKRLVRDIIVGESAPRPEELTSSSQNECLQLSFHRALRDILCLVYPKEILLVDLRIQHSIAVIPTSDRGYTPFHQVLFCRQRDAVLCVHESGALTFRSRRPCGAAESPEPSWNNSNESASEIFYDQRCQTEGIRHSKNNKVLAAAMDPVLESRAALLLNDGKIFFYELASSENGLVRSQTALCDLMGPLYWSKSLLPLKMTLFGLLCQVNSASVIKMCPPLTLKNWQNHSPLLAVGCTNGFVQFFNVATGILEKEIAVHSYPVKGIEWTGLHTILSHGQTLTSGNAYRNELLLTNVKTGKVTVVRPERGDENPIDLVRVSALKQYFIVTFKDSPLELWDLRRLTLLRTLPRKFPAITALEWSPLHLPRLHRKSVIAEDSDGSTANIPAVTTKEFFVFADPDNNLYHLTVEGSVVKDCERLATPALNGIIAMTWKHDFLALGDAEGGIAIWDWRNRTYRHLPSSRSPIRKLRFAPGKHNLKLLVFHAEGIDVWDVRESERLGQWRNSPFRDVTNVLDADWAASDCPVFLCSDGTVRVFDVTLQKCSAPVQDYADSPAVYALLPPAQKSTVRASFQLNLVQETLADFEEFHDNGDLILSERCLKSARLCGDLQLLELWNVACYYLKYQQDGHKPDNLQPLDTCYDILCDPRSYKQNASDRANLYEAKPRAYEHSRQLARELLLLNEKDKVIALLLNTESTHEQFYSNHLLACLTAALQTSNHGNAHSTVKLVATHLIASGQVWQGIELMILNGQVLDACRYLQSNNLWEDSARVAKLLLMEEDPASAADIWNRWAQHLAQNRQKFLAVLAAISVGLWLKAAELLVQLQMSEAAALLLRAAQTEAGFEPVEESAKSFLENVHYEYARHLNSIGLTNAAKEWASYAGSKGQSLVSEWDILSADN